MLWLFCCCCCCCCCVVVVVGGGGTLHLKRCCLGPNGALDGADHRAGVALLDVNNAKLPGAPCAAGGDVARYVTRQGLYDAVGAEDGQHQQFADVPGHDPPHAGHVGFKAHVGAPQYGRAQRVQGKLRPYCEKKTATKPLHYLHYIGI